MDVHLKEEICRQVLTKTGISRITTYLKEDIYLLPLLLHPFQFPVLKHLNIRRCIT